MRNSLFILSVLCVAALSCSSPGRYVSITGYAQGGNYMVKLCLEGEGGPVAESPETIKGGIDSVLAAVDNSISGYNKSSLLSRFNSGEAIVPDEIFLDIYERAYQYYVCTDGCVDVSSSPLFDVWGFGFTTDSLPSAKEVEQIRANVGMRRLHDHIEPAGDGTFSAADLLIDGKGVLPRLNYNAIAQGYSCDLVASYLHSIGVDQMLVDVGGEIYCEGLNPSGKPWTVGLDRPVDGNDRPGADLQGIFRVGPEPKGVVTSGNYRKFYVKDGQKYAHTIDPRTGYPVTHSLLSATIIAGDATEADALATYCMVIGVDAAREFIMSRPDLEGCLVYDDDGVMKSWTSAGFMLEEAAE